MPFGFPRKKAAPKLPSVRPMLSPEPYTPDVDPRRAFWRTVNARKPASVLEVGTRRSSDDRPTHKLERFPWVKREDFVMLDIREGIDVDLIGDLHALPADWSERFDCFIAAAVFEHLERPWIAAREVARILRPGGLFFITTHQCYPLHGHPNDFFRFSREALSLLFDDAGLVVDASGYSDRCMIVPPEGLVPYGSLAAWNHDYPSYAMVRAFGHKP